MEYRVQDLVFPSDSKHLQARSLFYRGENGLLDREKGSLGLGYAFTCDLITYINAFSYRKWKRYTFLEKAVMYLDVEGPVTVNYAGYEKDAMTIRRTDFGTLKNVEGRHTLRFEFPDSECMMIGAEVVSEGISCIHGGYYCAEIDEAHLRTVNLSLSTTTMKKEEFIIGNIKSIRETLLESDDDIADHLYVHVVDNGRTLDETQIFGKHVSLHPNNNAGGSGGFARGMMESMHQKECEITHVLLMDDDVLVLPESIRRTFKLLRMMRPEYQNHFISGAMLYFEMPNKQHEDIGSVDSLGFFRAKKQVFNHNKLFENLSNEDDFPTLNHEYGAWWYCCIPMDVIKENGLPMPFFIRGDDVEYSLRCKAKLITMNAICVWHMGFTMKYSASLEIYQELRDLLVAQAASGVIQNVDLYKHWAQHTYRQSILNFNYNSAELALRAMEDFLKGPEFFMKDRGFEILQNNNKLNDIFRPIEEFTDIHVEIRDKNEVIYDSPRKPLDTFLFRLSYNGHRFLPKALEKKGVAVIGFGRTYQPGKTALHNQVLMVNPYAKTGVLLTKDKARFEELNKRFHEDVKYYREHIDELRKAYQEKQKYLTSEEFWRQYLELDSPNGDNTNTK